MKKNSNNKGNGFPRFRGNHKPRNPKTECQHELRSKFCLVTRLWQDLTYKQVIAWNDFVKRYEIKTKNKKRAISAFNFFVKTNMNLKRIGLEPIKDCPERLYAPILPESYNVEIHSEPCKADILLSFKPMLDDNNVIVVSATPHLRGYSYQKKQLRTIAVIDNSMISQKGSISILSDYVRRYGSVPEGRTRIGFSVQVIEKRSGQVTKAVCVLGMSEEQ